MCAHATKRGESAHERHDGMVMGVILSDYRRLYTDDAAMRDTLVTSS